MPCWWKIKRYKIHILHRLQKNKADFKWQPDALPLTLFLHYNYSVYRYHKGSSLAELRNIIFSLAQHNNNFPQCPERTVSLRCQATETP